MTIDKIAAVYDACCRAREAQLDALEAADAAGLPTVLVTEDQVVALERAAVRTLVEATPANPDEAERRDEILLRVAAAGDHTDILPVCQMAAFDLPVLVVDFVDGGQIVSIERADRSAIR